MQQVVCASVLVSHPKLHVSAYLGLGREGSISISHFCSFVSADAGAQVGTK